MSPKYYGSLINRSFVLNVLEHVTERESVERHAPQESAKVIMTSFATLGEFDIGVFALGPLLSNFIMRINKAMFVY